MNQTANTADMKCRVCSNSLFDQPLARYENMPAVAQNLPTADSLSDDKGVDLDVFQCAGCGLVQLDPAAEPVSYFREMIRATGFSPEMKNFRMKQFSDFVQKYALSKKKVIEIGSGRGEYLSLMQDAGADAYGLEYGEGSVAESEKLGLKVSRGFVESSDYKIPHGPFAAFFMLNFLEHLPEPNQALRGIRSNLEEGAVGLVEVPNFDMILRNNLFSEFMRDHLFYFTKESLSSLLALNGFEVISCEEVWNDYSISAVVRKRGMTDVSSFAAYQSKIQKEIDDFLKSHDSVAVWGAGHQAFAIMSMMNLAGRIKYVVDSAPFKQGKFTPATHIPIVSPEKLKSDPVSAVIIMAGSYSDEVKKIMQEKYPNVLAVILREHGLEK